MTFHPLSSAHPQPRRSLSVAPWRGGWAIKHGDGYLGASATLEEALALLRALQTDAPAERPPTR